MNQRHLQMQLWLLRSVFPGFEDPSNHSQVVPAAFLLQEAYENFRRNAGNAYITAIRGRKHVCESKISRIGVTFLRYPDLRIIAVRPEYQGQGVAGRLLQWGVDLADRKGFYGWLNGRPAGMKLYRKAGWETVAVSEFNVPDIEVAPFHHMLRKPDMERKGVIGVVEEDLKMTDELHLVF